MSVYKLTDGEKVYYGSTIKTLKKRLAGHRSIHNDCETRQLNKDNMTIELLEEVEDKEQRLWRERYYIENNECVNKQTPIISNEEYKELRKKHMTIYTERVGRDYIRKKDKEYREKNAEKLKQQRAIPFTCECGSVIVWCGKVQHFKSKKHINFINNIDE